MRKFAGSAYFFAVFTLFAPSARSKRAANAGKCGVRVLRVAEPVTVISAFPTSLNAAAAKFMNGPRE